MTPLQSSEKPLPESVIKSLWISWARIGHQPRMRMMTGSMRPLIQAGDELHIELQPKVIQLGDILIYRHRGQFIAHRLVDIRQSSEGEQFILKGDATPRFDAPLPRERIIGRVTYVEGVLGGTDYNTRRWQRLNGWVARFSKSNQLYSFTQRYAKPVITSIFAIIICLRRLNGH